MFFERLQQRLEAGLEALPEPRQVGGAGDGEPLIVLVHERFDQGGGHGGDHLSVLGRERLRK